MGHSHPKFPNPQSILHHSNSRVPIAATADPISDDYKLPEATYVTGVNIVNMVSAKPLNFMTAGTRFNNFPSLFDTGSPVSFVRYSSLSEDAVKVLNKQKTQPTGLMGLGGANIISFGNLNHLMKFNKKIAVV